ncbi:SAGA-associated factor 29-like [Corticium candelabrum]|uniref:SAGA-associated factor 29-like n=1 Tax=Corticium candelabrum TaxID=121492 RepID=UPI002E25F146|nr:SAGA-associated factor 29-like [Corticium candelabrum]XP_062512599.1 SAGA-associated factor 29-like [Corticium candelabrum]XP_062512603.1 SAGA-associated factor 29-like [Corticium candelabrum]XP_062512611.1 SAGA-associated factor 29-like [Corticium candelabrum]
MAENAVKAALKELHLLVKKTQEERVRAEPTLVNIAKTHDKMKAESKVSAYFKNKLKSLYVAAQEDARKEAGMLQRCLDKIAEVKMLRSKVANSAATMGHSKAGASGLAASIFETEQPRKPVMRRGVLISLLQQAANQLPVWRPQEPDEKPPPLCGAIPAEHNFVPKPGSQVCARIQGQDGEEQWILAEVISYNAHLCKYTVEDIDEEGSTARERHVLTKRKVLALPSMKADPAVTPSAIHSKGQSVMAVYPQTTCFYKGFIASVPSNVDDDYSVLFEDVSYPEGYSPALKVPQRYILPIKERKR